MIRCFISINIPENIKQKIKEIQDKLPEFKGKKTEFENLHLTLKFLGEISEEKLEKVKERLKEINFKSFEVEIDQIGVFAENFVRIIWLHVSNTDKLQREVDESLKDLFKKEKRFMGHLTIARVKEIQDKKKFIFDLRKIKFDKINFTIGCFDLKESVLTEKGPIYKTLEKYTLESC